MPPTRSRFSLLVLLALLPAFAPVQAATPGARLQQVQLDTFELKQADLDEAIQVLRTAMAAAAPDAPGVNIVISPAAREQARPVTVELRGVSAAVALQMILRLSNTRAETRGGMIWILPPS